MKELKKTIEQLILSKLKNVLSILIENNKELMIKEIWLFGSVARGNYNDSSDIDILIITYHTSSSEISYKVELLDVRDEINFPNVDVVVRTQKEIDNTYYWFNTEVKKDKIVLWRRAGNL